MIGNTERKNFKRVILKLSGEALREPGSEDNISPEIVETVASQIKLAHQAGIEIGVVVGGGNFWRVLVRVTAAWKGPLLITLECWQQL